MMIRLFRWPGIAALMLCAVTVRAQGFHWEIGPDDSTGAAFQVSFDRGKMKVESANSADPVLIVRLDQRSVLVVNERRGSYTELSFQDWKAMRNQQSALVVQIPPDIQQLPQEERDKRLHEYVASTGAGGAKPDVIRIGDSKVIQGYPCTKWIVKQENRIVLTVWSTREVKEFESIRHDLQECYRQVSLNYPSLRWLPDALRGIDGFPIRFGVGDDVAVVRKLERRNWGEDEFEAPSGFRKTSAAVPGR